MEVTKEFLIYLYNTGYHAGHHDTVEAQYTDVLPVDMDSFHAEIVEDVIDEYLI